MSSNIDLEASGFHFKASIDSLQSLYDPKSLKGLNDLTNGGHLQNLIDDLGTDIQSGLALNNTDSETRIKTFGANRLPEKSYKSFLGLCWEALHDQVLIILSVSAIVSLALGLYETFCQPPEFDDDGNPLPQLDWVEGCAIILAILIVVVVGALNDFNKQKQFMKLNAKKEDRKIIVYRSGEKHYISVYHLLVGDLLYVETGDIIPADSILVNGECQCDESSVTGESKTIHKSIAQLALKSYNTNGATGDIGDSSDILDPFLISGSKLLSGQGKAVVTCVGVNSMHGKIMMSLDHEEDPTPLQQKLDVLANGISKYGFMASIILFFVLFAKFIFYLSTTMSSLTPAQKASRFIDIVITSITIVVVAIPEGLPLAVTLALAFATTRMTEDGNLVRVLKSCETMGCATAICSDKTGTLTVNKMTIVEGFIGHDSFNESAPNNDSLNVIKKMDKKFKKCILQNILLNSTAFENNEDKDDSHHDDFQDDDEFNENDFKLNHKPHFWSRVFHRSNNHHRLPREPSVETSQKKDDFMGSKTECALITMARDKFYKIDSPTFSLSAYRDENESNYVQLIPFESSLKWSGIVIKNPSINGFTFYIKGASEIVFSRCTYYLTPSNKLTELNKDSKSKINNHIFQMASHALRTVSLAHYNFENMENWKKLSVNELFSKPLVLDMTVGIQDPLRPGVELAIEQCHIAGVTVRMVTGDNLNTARAISLKCGILDDHSFNNSACFMEGPIFRKLSDEERLKIVPNLHVLARSSPEDKRILVETLKNLGEVVAVTGDGTNDAPALKLADVGFSMGISGTEVAREASDIILMTDDFTSIVNAIKWGRTVASSIKKFVQFQLTVNVTAVILTFVTAVSSKDNDSVLTAVQLLWVNLIMDTLAALALATDKPDDNFLKQKPEGRNSRMITFSMWKMILGLSSVQLTITLLLHFYGAQLFYSKPMHDLRAHEKQILGAMTFNTFVWMQVFTLFVNRKLNECDGVENLKDRINSNNLGFFEGLSRNLYFIAIVVLISVFQIIIMLFGGAAFSVTKQSLSMWITAIGCGYLMIPFGMLLRIIPDHLVMKVVPVKFFQKIIYGIEWFMFGCPCPNSNNRNEEIEENHMLRRLVNVLSAHSSEDDLGNVTNTRERFRSPSQEYLFDQNRDSSSYTETERSANAANKANVVVKSTRYSGDSFDTNGTNQ